MSKDFLKLGIIGKPLSHSISPVLQNEAIKSVGKTGEYKKFECDKDCLPETIKFFKENGYLGFNVTIPHKENILKYLDFIDETAQKIGAVNTVKIENGELFGYNTDIFGFIEPIKNRTFNNAVILGAGGAARAIVFGLDKLNIKNITVCARDINKANIFINSLKDKINANIYAEMLSENSDYSNTDILVNCTPLGMKGKFENQIPTKLENVNKKLFVYDIVYNPQETLLLKQAKENFLECINGLDMLVFQGAKAFEIWTEEKPDISKMKKVALEYFK